MTSIADVTSLTTYLEHLSLKKRNTTSTTSSCNSKKYANSIFFRFKTQCNLLRHKEYHGGVQYPCGVCGRVYPTNSTLRAHSITHSDLRPHECPMCDKTFKRNQDLKVCKIR